LLRDRFFGGAIFQNVFLPMYFLPVVIHVIM
jgi:hypothetical protein